LIDIKLIREDKDKVLASLRRRGFRGDFGNIIELDEARLTLLKEVEELKREKNIASDKIGLAKKKGEECEQDMVRMKEVSGKIKNLDNLVKETQDILEKELLNLPNLPHPDVPDGLSEENNVEVKKWGIIRDFAYPVKSHQEIGESLGILDFARGTKVSGSGFVIYRDLGAKLARALINFMLNTHAEKGYREVSPPFMVNRESCLTTGNLPKFEDDLYAVGDKTAYLIPTAEVPVTNMHRGEILPEKSLPIKYAAYTPCFRREAGSWGQDTKGLIRQHQFDKVELVKFVKPEESYKELESLLADAEDILQRLNLPYRVVKLCAGDMGFSAAATYDIEVWLPSQNRYREISSCSNFENFQARRGDIKYRPEGGGKAIFLNTLNGSALAVGRTIVAILENYQEEDGSVTLPEPLRPYLNGVERITKYSPLTKGE